MDSPAVSALASPHLPYPPTASVKATRSRDAGSDETVTSGDALDDDVVGLADPASWDGEKDSPEEDAAPQLSKYERGWRRIIRNFSPSWFSTTMGTGIVSVLLISIPYQARCLYYLSLFFFALNALLFLAASAASVLRYALYPAIWHVMLMDPFNSLFLATIPMGFATLVRMWLAVCVPAWGEWALTGAWVAWMVDAVAAVGTTVFMTFRLMAPSNSPSPLSNITAVQLLPIASTIVASALGAGIADVLPNPTHALGTLITVYVMWGMSMPLALTVIAMYYQRLAVHKLPSREVIVSCFLPLGPLGYGGYGLLLAGRAALHIFPHTHTLARAGPDAAPMLYAIGFLTALLLWGFGLVFLVLALASIYKSRPFPFNMGWWGFTFPLGVFALSTLLIGEELGSAVFRVLGTVFAAAVMLLWVVVAGGTARGAWSGRLFRAPCLVHLKEVGGRGGLVPSNVEAQVLATAAGAGAEQGVSAAGSRDVNR